MTHNGSVHQTTSELEFSQGPPPLAGAGLLQTLDLDLNPFPHVAVQVLQAAQFPQLPPEKYLLYQHSLCQSMK